MGIYSFWGRGGGRLCFLGEAGLCFVLSCLSPRFCCFLPFLVVETAESISAIFSPSKAFLREFHKAKASVLKLELN